MGTIIMDRNQPNKNIIKIRINQPIAPQPHQHTNTLIFYFTLIPSYRLPTSRTLNRTPSLSISYKYLS